MDGVTTNLPTALRMTVGLLFRDTAHACTICPPAHGADGSGAPQLMITTALRMHLTCMPRPWLCVRAAVSKTSRRPPPAASQHMFVQTVCCTSNGRCSLTLELRAHSCLHVAVATGRCHTMSNSDGRRA